MTIIFNRDFKEAECNGCEMTLDLDEYDDFYEAVEALKEDGWRIFKDGDDWVHYCPDCR